MPMSNLFKKTAGIVLLATILLFGCGRKGAPQPPEAIAPRPVKNLSVQGTITSIRLHWEAPDKTASGDALKDLAGFVVKRNEYERGERADFDDIAEVSLKEKSEDAEDSSGEELYSYEDTSVEPGKWYEYVVVAENEDGIEGGAADVLRLRFVGESSTFERFAP